jgi:hypothetical protein
MRMSKTLEDIIREALANPGGIMHVDVVHEKYCPGSPCDCEPDYKKQRKPQ